MADQQHEIIKQLHRVFGDKDITEDVIQTLFVDHQNNVEAVVDALLNLSKKADSKKESPQDKASQQRRVEDDREREKNVQTILAMFGNDLSRSVISTVYQQNEGDVAQAVDMLLDIYHDEDAIEAIRTMGAQQKKKLEAEMKADQEKRVAERQAQLENEIREERKKLEEEKMKLAKEKEKEVKVKEHLDLLRKQREQELKEIEQKKREEDALRNERDQARLAEIEKQRKAQEERNKALLLEVERQVAERARLEKEMKEREEARDRQEKAKLEEIKNKELLVSRIVQQSALVTLGVRYGAKTVIVSWSLGTDLKAAPSDWIGFYKLGMPNEKYREYISTAGEREGSHHFTAPKTPGLYQFRYFRESSYNEVAHSDLIHIGPQITLISALAQADNGKDRIDVTAILSSGEVTTKDWFGLYHAEEKNNKNYLSMRYIQSSELQTKKIVFTFEAPRTPGDYVVRFFPERCRYTSTAHGNNLRVLNRDKLTIDVVKDNATQRPLSLRIKFEIRSVDVSAKDYIGIYKTSAPNNSYVSYGYIDPTKDTLELAAPSEVDQYEARYHSASQSRYADVARSASFAVPNTDVVTAEIASGVLTVSWSIHSQPRSTWDWVGIFAKGAANTKYIAFKYIDSTSSALFFDVPKDHGVYEARYFSNALGKYVDFRKSKEFQIA